MEWKISCLLAALLLVSSATCYPLFPFSSCSNDVSMGMNDDSSRTTGLRVPFQFYGRSYRLVRVYNNGYVSLGSGVTGGYTPRPFPFRGAPMIAPYWADVDTRVGPGRVYYRESASRSDRTRAKSIIRITYSTNFMPTRVFIVTWNRVGYYSRHQNRLNTFQLVMATDGTRSFAMFLYGSMSWTTGDASGGRGGFGGHHARAGLNAGDGRRQITIPNSGSRSIVNIRSRSNVGRAGLYVYRTDLSSVPPRPIAPSPTPRPTPRPTPISPPLRLPSTFLPLSGSSSHTLSRSDDGYQAVRLQTPVRLYDGSYQTVYISNNGYISLNGYTGSYTPRPFPYRTVRPIIAPFWADVDTRVGDGRVYYTQTTSTFLRSRAAAHVRRTYGGSFNPTHLFIATWYRVGYYGRHMNRRNTFQLVIASDARCSFIIFIYDQLQWTTGDASGGHNGIGGRVARAGINAGDGRNSISLYGSGTNLMLRMNYNSNCGARGVYVLSPGRAEVYPFGSSAGDRNLGRNDDGSMSTTFLMPFYHRTERILRVYNNGYLSMRGSAGGFTPHPFPLRGNPMIAPYWADGDTRTGSGRVYFRSTTNGAQRQRARFEIEATLGRSFNPTRLFVATWYQIGYYNRHQDKLNTFQAVLATDGRSTYVIFIYKDIRWTTGDSSGGRRGIGGRIARAGLNAGDGRTSLTITGSGTSTMLNLERMTNVRIPGMYILNPNQLRTACPVAVGEEFASTSCMVSESTDVEYIDAKEFEAAHASKEVLEEIADTVDEDGEEEEDVIEDQKAVLEEEVERVEFEGIMNGIDEEFRSGEEEVVVEEEKAEYEVEESETEREIEAVTQNQVDDSEEEVVDEEYQELGKEKLVLIEDDVEVAEEGGGGEMQGGKMQGSVD